MKPASLLRSPSWRGFTATSRPSALSLNPAQRPCGAPRARWRCVTDWVATICARMHWAISAAAGSHRVIRAGPTISSAQSPLGAAETRLEKRVRTYVNAAGSAYRAGRMHDAERYVAEGLRLAADGEFAAGQYRLHLTSAAVGMSTGDWDRAIAELRQLLTGPGQPGVMALLARALLARLLARRGEPEASAVLDGAWRDPLSAGDSYVAGPLAVAQVEVSWLAGTVDGVPPAVYRAFELAVDCGHTAIQAELCGYLRRAGHDLAAPDDIPGPWAPSLAGRWRQAAQAWEKLGDRYEQAVELAWAGDDKARTAGLAILTELGATATVARVLARGD